MFCVTIIVFHIKETYSVVKVYIFSKSTNEILEITPNLSPFNWRHKAVKQRPSGQVSTRPTIFELSSSTNKSRLLEEAARPFIFPSDSAALTNPAEERKKERKKQGRRKAETTARKHATRKEYLRDVYLNETPGRENTPHGQYKFPPS